MTPTTNGTSNGYHAPTPDPEPSPERRQPGYALALILATLTGGTVTGVTSYGVYHRARPPCAAPAAFAKDDCTCPTCPGGQACYKVNCTCVAVAVAVEMERKDEQRRTKHLLRLLMEQRLADSCGGNLTEVELR